MIVSNAEYPAKLDRGWNVNRRDPQPGTWARRGRRYAIATRELLLSNCVRLHDLKGMIINAWLNKYLKYAGVAIMQICDPGMFASRCKREGDGSVEVALTAFQEQALTYRTHNASESHSSRGELDRFASPESRPPDGLRDGVSLCHLRGDRYIAFTCPFS